MAIHASAKLFGRGRVAAALGAALALTACGEGAVISQVDRSVALDRQRVLAMAQPANAIPLEIHGALWAGVSAETVANTLRLPNSFPPNIQFRLAPPGSLDRDVDRVALVFNPASPPSARRVCETTTPIATEPPRDGPFKAFMAFCSGPDWMGNGTLDATKQQTGDWEEFVRVMRVFFSQILTDYSGRSDK